jgi:hypothetical protein
MTGACAVILTRTSTASEVGQTCTGGRVTAVSNIKSVGAFPVSRFGLVVSKIARSTTTFYVDYEPDVK